MNLERSLETLRKYNEWRRDKQVPSPRLDVTPEELGKAIDYACYCMEVLKDVEERFRCTDRSINIVHNKLKIN